MSATQPDTIDFRRNLIALEERGNKGEETSVLASCSLDDGQ